MPQSKSKEGTQLNHIVMFTWKILTELAVLSYQFNFKGSDTVNLHLALEIISCKTDVLVFPTSMSLLKQ